MNKVFGKYSYRVFRLLIACLFLSGLLAGCDEEESCFSFSTNQYQLAFYVIGENGRPTASPFAFDEVDVLESDSAFFTWSATGANSVSLALNPASDTTTFLFKYGERNDTVKVAYRRTLNMISPECGMEMQYSDLNLFYHSFDSVRNLTTELLETNEGLDVAIYSFSQCPSPFVSLFRAGFLAINENDQIRTDIVNFDSVQAVGNDSIFFARNEGGTENLNLALNPEADSTVFTFRNGAEIDTLVVEYTREARIFSPACGYEPRYVNLSVSSTFDSVRLLSTTIPENATQDFDVEIYRFE